MRKFPYGHLILAPALIMGLGPNALVRLWEELRRQAKGLPKKRGEDGNADLLRAVIEALPNPGLEDFLLNLGLAAARLRAAIPLSGNRGNVEDHIIDVLCEKGLVGIDEICIETLAYGPIDRIYVYDSMMQNFRGHLCGFLPDDTGAEQYTFPSSDYCDSGLFAEYSGLALRVRRSRGGWVTECFLPRSQCFVVYAPQLSSAGADEAMRDFFVESSLAGLRAEVKDDIQRLRLYREQERQAPLCSPNDLPGEIYGCYCHIRDYRAQREHIRKVASEATNMTPLMLPLDMASFGLDDAPERIDLGDLGAVISLRKSLAMSRFEWGNISHGFESKYFTSTGLIADRVLDEEHPGEWCRVHPRGTVYCNPLRREPARHFERAGDAEILRLSDKAFAAGTFRWLAGKAKLHESPGTYWVMCENVRIYLSLAPTEEELLQQVMSLVGTVVGKVVFITAFLTLGQIKGIVALREVCGPSSYREELLRSDGLCAKAKAAREHLASKVGGRTSALEAAYRAQIDRWEGIVGRAVHPVEVFSEMSVPKAPQGAGWENLRISLKIDEGRQKIKFSYTGLPSRQRCYESLWLDEQWVPRLFQTLKGKAFEILAKLEAASDTKRGRPSKASKRAKAKTDTAKKRAERRRQYLHRLGETLAKLTGLDLPKGGILNHDGSPIFQIKVRKEHESDIAVSSPECTVYDEEIDYTSHSGRVSTQGPKDPWKKNGRF